MNAEIAEAHSILGAADVSDWLVIDQEHLSEFGHSTYLVVYFDFARPVIETEGGYGFNYGFNRVRFTEPVFVNEAVRVRRTVIEVQQKTPTRQLVTYDIVLEVQRDEPVTAMTAQWTVTAGDGAAASESEESNTA